jgi:flagellar biosynthesis/type III secretory pathway protein FliH
MSSSERRIIGRTVIAPSAPSSSAAAGGQVLRGTLADRRRASVPGPSAPIARTGGGALAGRVTAGRPGTARPGEHRADAVYGVGAPFGAEDVTVELDELRETAEARGYADGLVRAEAQLAAAIDAVASLAAELESVAPRETTAVAHAIAEVALAVARRVIDNELSIDPSVLASAVEDAVGLVNGSPEVRIYLNPAAVDAVCVAWEARHGRMHLGKRWVFESDPTLPPGGCVLRHEHGFVDAGLEAQLEEIGIALDRAIPTLLHAAQPEEAA